MRSHEKKYFSYLFVLPLKLGSKKTKKTLNMSKYIVLMYKYCCTCKNAGTLVIFWVENLWHFSLVF